MHARLTEAFRTLLTIAGLLLLVIFGARAAAQATNPQLAGAHNFGFPSIHLGSLGLLGSVQTTAAAYSTWKHLEAAPPHQSATTSATKVPAAAQGSAQTQNMVRTKSDVNSKSVQPTETTPTTDSTTPTATSSQESSKHTKVKTESTMPTKSTDTITTQTTTTN